MEVKVVSRFLRFLAAVPLLALPLLASAELDWAGVSGLSDADKAAIVRLAQDSGMANLDKVSVFTRLPSSYKTYVISTPVLADGLRRTWREVYVCRVGAGNCGAVRASRRGGWALESAVTTQERWRIADGDWFADVELGSGISYAEAQSIIVAIHRNALVGTHEPKDYSGALIAANNLSMQTIDPVAGEFVVILARRGAGSTSLYLRLRAGEVELHEVLMVNA